MRVGVAMLWEFPQGHDRAKPYSYVILIYMIYRIGMCIVYLYIYHRFSLYFGRGWGRGGLVCVHPT